MKDVPHVVLKILGTWKSKMNLANQFGKSSAIIVKNSGTLKFDFSLVLKILFFRNF